MDLSTTVATDRDYDVLHPATSEPIGLKLTLRPDSAEEIKKAERRWLTQGLRGRRLTAEQLEARGTDILVATIAGWEWGKGPDGEPLTFEGAVPEFTEANVRKVLKALPWVKKQVDNEAGYDSAFFKA